MAWLCKIPGMFCIWLLKRCEVTQITYVSISHYGNAPAEVVSALDAQNVVVAPEIVGQDIH